MLLKYIARRIQLTIFIQINPNKLIDTFLLHDTDMINNIYKQMV